MARGRPSTARRDGRDATGAGRLPTAPISFFRTSPRIHSRSGRWAIADGHDDRDVQFRELGGKLELDYPVQWVYKVIGTDESELRAAVLDVVSADDEMTLELSNRSSGGTYVSMNVEVHVVDESHRKTIYRSLREHPDVRMVL